MENILFGNKENFGIEIQPTIIPNTKGYLRLWILGNAIGGFKRRGEFIHGIRNLKKYFTSKEYLYETIFGKFNDFDFIDYLIPWPLVNSKDPKDWDEATRRSVYTRFLGDQLDDFSIFSLYKDGIITWIIYQYKNKKNPVKIYKLSAKEVEQVFSEYIQWYETEFGEVQFNPNVFP